MSASAVYEGWVRHRRFEPVEHDFRYRLFLMYLDLAELPELLDPFPLWSARRPAPARFRRADFMGDPARPLAECARDARRRPRPAARPGGPVRLLAGLRYLGHVFNPVSFYYCFDAAGERVEAVVADVNNIPWGERHPYVLARGDRERPGAQRRARQGAPRLPADGDGPDLRLPRHRARLSASIVHIESRPRGRGKAFDATLSLRRRELSRPLMAALLARYPAMSLQVVAKIYAPVAAPEAEGRPLLPPPGGRRPKGFISP